MDQVVLDQETMTFKNKLLVAKRDNQGRERKGNPLKFSLVTFDSLVLGWKDNPTEDVIEVLHENDFITVKRDAYRLATPRDVIR